jgi:lysozyme
MTPFTRNALKQILFVQEGFRDKPYTDTTGHLTIGIGRNLSDRGISLNEAYDLLENDIEYFEGCLQKVFPFYDRLSQARQAVLVNMAFNLGLKNLLEFKKFVEYLADNDYSNAAKEMLDSVWAKQVGARAQVLAAIMQTNELQIES